MRKGLVCGVALMLTTSGAARDRSVAKPVIQSDAVSLFGADNYPPAALRAGEQGRVVAELSVGPDGVVGDCRIEESSGSVSLDEATCKAGRRVLFDPARDRRGRAIASTYLLPVRWTLPIGVPGETFSPIAASAIEVEQVVDRDGRRRQCVFRLNGKEEANEAICAAAGQGLATFMKDLPADLRERAFVLLKRWRLEFAGLKPPPPFDTTDGQLLQRVVVRFTVAADGSVSSCRVEGDADPERRRMQAPCADSPPFRAVEEPVSFPVDGIRTETLVVRLLPAAGGI